MRKTVFLALMALAVAFMPVAGQATITSYTNEAAFLNALAPGYYTEDFSGIGTGDLGVSTMNFSGGVFSYDLSSFLEATPSNLWVNPTGISTEDVSYPMFGSNFASTGNALAGVGGYFFIADSDGNPLQDMQVSVGINGTFTTITTPDNIGSLLFFGVIDDAPTGITSLSAAVYSISSGYVTINNLTVGALPSPVPVPPAALLLGSGLLGLIGFRRKFAK